MLQLLHLYSTFCFNLCTSASYTAFDAQQGLVRFFGGNHSVVHEDGGCWAVAAT